MSKILDEVMKELGYAPHSTVERVYVFQHDRPHLGPCLVDLSGFFGDIVDRMYCAGHRDGWERGAYEEQQKEDVEPGDVISIDTRHR